MRTRTSGSRLAGPMVATILVRRSTALTLHAGHAQPVKPRFEESLRARSAARVGWTHTMSGRDIDPAETREWLEALDAVVDTTGPSARRICSKRSSPTRASTASRPPAGSTRRTSTRSTARTRPQIPGDPTLERRLRSLVRWNAMATVLQANKESAPSSAATSPATSRRRRSTRSASTTSGTRPADDHGGDLGLHPGPLVARHLRARLPRGAARARSRCSASARRSAAAGCPRTRTRG